MPVSHCPALSVPVPYIWTILRSPTVPPRPVRPSPKSPAAPPPPSICASILPPWRNGWWQGASCSVHARAPACRINRTAGEGGSPPPKWWLYPVHAGGKFYPRCCPCCRPSHTHLKREVLRSPDGHKFHPVGKWLPIGGRRFPTPSPLRFPPMLCMYVSRQRPESHLLPALHALNLTPLSVLLWRPCSHNPSHICRIRLRPRHLAQVADHSYCLPDVSLQAHPVKKV